MNFKLILIKAFVLFALSGLAQQSNSLFLLHELPQSNILNPAVPLTCKWYVGLPVLSSIHLNYSNSSFTYNQLFTLGGNNKYQPNIIGLSDKLHRRNSIGTELHLQLFALGYRNKKNSFLFTITEKDNLLITYPKNTILLLFEGNAQFIGKEVGIKGTGLFFNHYREYAIGYSKKIDNQTHIGVKAKLLFGKLNVSTKKLNLNVDSDELTRILDINGDMFIRSSIPLSVDASNNRINNFSYNDEMSPVQLLLNRKNPGFAADFGIVHKYSRKLELSASVIDLGVIRWKSNLNAFQGKGQFLFEGISANTGVNDSSYFQNFTNTLLDSVAFEVVQKKYFTMLPLRIIAGVNYTLTDYFKVGAVANGIFYRMKTMTSFTIIGQFRPKPWLTFTANYSIQNYSLNNLGAGLVLGKRPVQFYIVSDNVLAFAKPLDTRNVNIRFGFNILFGCGRKIKDPKKRKSNEFTCFGMSNPNLKKYRENLVSWEKRKKQKKNK